MSNTTGKKGWLINSADKTITEILVNNSKDFYTHIGNECNCFACPVEFPKRDTLYVDDEGLFHPFEGAYMFKDWSYPIVGNGVIIGSTTSGNNADVKMTKEWLETNIIWVSKEKAQQHAENYM